MWCGRIPKVRFMVAGDCSATGSAAITTRMCASFCSRPGLTDFFIFTGSRADCQLRLMGAFDILVLSTHAELAVSAEWKRWPMQSRWSPPLWTGFRS